ncbi:MAG: DNA-processing protein DprA [Pirellulaceae bacterium]|nr:DNA-processing protein DprA [Pirellulaceae bacterium]
MDHEASLDYLQLALTAGVGVVLIERLLERFGSPTAVLAASPAQLCEVPGVSVAVSRNIRSPQSRTLAEQTLESCQAGGIDILMPHHDAFPRLLKEIADTPSLLFVRGTLLAQDELSLAIVGTRTASHYGRSQAARFANSLSRAGLTIVSGLARGIDAAAHTGAIEAGGRTIAVLGSGVHDIYPPQHAELAERIVGCGALVSEMPPGTKPKSGMFPRRNRLISGLCIGTLVIEAPERSGALITARLAAEQGRDVFAMPGLVTSPAARGCHKLIRDGAILVQDPEDVIEALGPLAQEVDIGLGQTVRSPRELQLNEQETAVLQSIQLEPTDVNSVIAASGLPVSRVLSTLSVLEMRKLIRRISGNVVQRV